MPVSWSRSPEERYLDGLRRLQQGCRYRCGDLETQKSKLFRAYANAIEGNTVLLQNSVRTLHPTGGRRMLTAVLSLPARYSDTTIRLRSRFFPSAFARYQTLSDELHHAQPVMEILPEFHQAGALENYQRNVELKNWLVAPHFLHGRKWSGKQFTAHEVEYLHETGWLDNDLTSGEEDYLCKHDIDVGDMTVRRVVAWVFADE